MTAGREVTGATGRRRLGEAASLPVEAAGRPSAAAAPRPARARADAADTPWAWRHPRLYELAFRLSPAHRLLRAREERAVLAALDALASPRDRVIEVGAGTGWYTAAVASRVAHLTAVEPAPRMRAFLQRRRSLRRRRNVAVVDGGLPDDLAACGPPADGLVCVGVLDYQEDLVPAFDAMARAVRAGGWVLCTVPARPPGRAVDGAPRLPIHDRSFARDEAEVIGAAERAGLRPRALVAVAAGRTPRTLVARLAVP